MIATVPMTFSRPREVVAMVQCRPFPMPSTPAALAVRAHVNETNTRRGGRYRVTLTDGLVGFFYGDQITVRDEALA